MNELTVNNMENAVLVGIITGKNNIEETTEQTFEELTLLAETAGANVIGIMSQNRPAPDTATYIGEGKLLELSEFCKNNQVDVVIFDDELSGSQHRNIENAIGTRVIDRSTLILDIFASRATSAEGMLEVELAQLKYMLPRLTGQGVSLSRLGGGIGTRGPGESKLETDKRHIKRRILTLELELKKVEKRRDLARKRRQKDGFLSAVLVGYTNAGKSSLMNRLTDAGVLSENKLFATLDPTARALELNDGRVIMLLDTVGFIRKLPHNLIKAFKSTLEEATEADLILHVNDISNSECSMQFEITNKLLSELGCEKIPKINIFNKCDINGDFQKNTKDTVYISATTGAGIDCLMKAITEIFSSASLKADILIPYNDAHLVSQLHNDAKVLSENYLDEGIALSVIIDKKITYKYEKYEVE